MAALAVVLAVAGMAILRAAAPRPPYRPVARLHQLPPDEGLAYETLSLRAADGVTLDAWHVRVADAPALVLLLHGAAGNMSDRLPYASAFAKAGLDTLLVDYRGYGRSGGTPSESGFALDADAAWSWAQGSGRPVVVYGEDLGAAVAAALAGRVAPTALILQSARASFAPAGWPAFLVPDRFDTLAALRKVRCPVVIVHGDRDAVAPWDEAQRLYDAAPDPKNLVRVEGAGHDDVIAGAADLIGHRTAGLVFERTQGGRAPGTAPN